MRTLSLLRQSVMITAVLIAASTMRAETPLPPVSAPLAIDTTTTIPGHRLKPGAYSIRVVDRVSDRYILRVEDIRGHAVATVIGLVDPGFGATEDHGAIPWANAPSKTAALRGFSFGNGLTVEFVYPKAEAVELAKLNEGAVPAIDPESEGRPPAEQLSDEDRQVVTLWALSSTKVGQGKGTPAIAAERFKAAPTTELAENSVPPPPAASSDASQGPAPVPSDGAKAARREPAVSAKAKSRTVADKLPQTASDLPLILLLSGALFAAGLAVGARRRSVTDGMRRQA